MLPHAVVVIYVWPCSVFVKQKHLAICPSHVISVKYLLLATWLLHFLNEKKPVMHLICSGVRDD